MTPQIVECERYKGASLLLVDDDTTFCRVLSRALGKRGFEVMACHSAEEAEEYLTEENTPEYAVIDLKMAGASGLSLIPLLKEKDAFTTIVVLTGYASITTAVEAIKLGATHYLAKPADADEIVRAFSKKEGDSTVAITEEVPSINRVEWEYMQKILQDTGGNISAASRILGIHRRTLQRKLTKRPSAL